MLIDKANKVVVGFDLGNDYSQVSYCRQDQSMPETVSLVMGEEKYNIATLLSYKPDQKGLAAWSLGKEGDELLIGDLLVKAAENTGETVGAEEFSAEYLLGIFIKKALMLLISYVKVEDITAVAFTLDDMDTALMDIVRRAAAQALPLKAQISFQSHEDCFFQYIIHQPSEMWIHNVLMYDYRDDGVIGYQLSMNRKTSPVACFIEVSKYPQLRVPVPDIYKQLDAAFLEVARKDCEQTMITSVFLLGDYFSKEWCRESLKYLCRTRRVFQGNNLFSKGACYGAREKMYPSTLSTSYVFLSDDKLRANIGMDCCKGQEEIYYPVLDAGTNWYDARKCFDVMLTKNNVITLNISPVDGSRTWVARISLEGLNVRGSKTNRIRLNFYMDSPSSLQIEITDMGFGDFFPSTGRVWKEQLPIETIM